MRGISCARDFVSCKRDFGQDCFGTLWRGPGKSSRNCIDLTGSRVCMPVNGLGKTWLHRYCTDCNANAAGLGGHLVWQRVAADFTSRQHRRRQEELDAKREANIKRREAERQAKAAEEAQKLKEDAIAKSNMIVTEFTDRAVSADPLVLALAPRQR
mmetsp:Transcript_99427/g.257166  ORF Transcript_99427/g.257166 Transcript_99427/m.257166 type:complete len:156 (-) Transcript_99427:108-575(-)